MRVLNKNFIINRLNLNLNVLQILILICLEVEIKYNIDKMSVTN